MGYKNQKWKDEYIEFLFELGKIKSKKERLILFKEKFPETNFSINAIATKMSEVGAVEKRKNVKGNRPLFSEQIKKGFVRIKIAEPSVWELKHKYIWRINNPDVEIKKEDVFIFLDGNNRNFAIENIEKVTRRELGLLNLSKGWIKENPELTKINLLNVRLKLKTFDIGEKTGEVVQYKNFRCFKKEFLKKCIAYNKKRYKENPEVRKKHSLYWKKYYEELKKNPEKFAEYKRKCSERNKRWRDKRRRKENGTK